MRMFVLFLLAMPHAVGVFAAGNTLFEKIGAISETCYGVRQQVPRGYYRDGLQQPMIVALNCHREQISNGMRHIGFAYYESAISRDGESKLLYPYFPLSGHSLSSFPFSKAGQSAAYARSCCAGELQTARYGGVAYDKPRLPASYWESQDSMTSLGGTEAHKWGRADSVFIADVPLNNRFQTRYTHCIAIYMAREGYVQLYVKLMLTDKGYADRSRRLKGIKGCLSYVSTPWQFDAEAVRTAILQG